MGKPMVKLSKRQMQLLAMAEKEAWRAFLKDVKEYSVCVLKAQREMERNRLENRLATLRKVALTLGKQIAEIEKEIGKSKVSTTSNSSKVSTTSNAVQIAACLKGKLSPKELVPKERKLYQKIHSYLNNHASEAWGLGTLEPENVNQLEG